MSTLGALSLLLGCLVQPQWDGFCLISLYLILSCWFYFLEDCSILMRDKKGPELEGCRGTGGVEGRETIARIYHMRKESIFNNRKKWKRIKRPNKYKHSSAEAFVISGQHWPHVCYPQTAARVPFSLGRFLGWWQHQLQKGGHVASFVGKQKE